MFCIRDAGLFVMAVYAMQNGSSEEEKTYY